MNSIVIVDYGMGNLGSIRNMLKRIGIEALVSSNHQEINRADKLILPGVGAFDAGMTNLHQLNLIDVLNKKVLENKRLMNIIFFMMVIFKSL